MTQEESSAGGRGVPLSEGFLDSKTRIPDSKGFDPLAAPGRSPACAGDGLGPALVTDTWASEQFQLCYWLCTHSSIQEVFMKQS